MTAGAPAPLAIVTGASSGIGRELALNLAARGYHTVVMARRAERLGELAREIEARFPVRCHAVAVDLSRVDDGRRAFDEAVEVARANGWKLTVLANNAGSGEWRPFTRVPLEKQLQVIDLNIKAATLLTRLFLDQVLGQEGRAYVLNVASMASFVPVPNYAVYSGTKGYLRYLNEALNFELKGTNVSLTCLCPGGTETEFLQVAGNEPTRLASLGMLPAATVAEVGLRALFKRKHVVVPGLSNRFVRGLLAVLPERLGQRLLNFVLGLGMKKDWE
jgi:short-subunit dehydrogenase